MRCASDNALLNVFRQFEKLYIDLSTAPLTFVSNKTGCKRPCSYKEYKFVNTNLKELTYADYPEDQLVLCLWAVSQYTQVFVFVLQCSLYFQLKVEEEVLVYPFQSLVADFGGSLGLFLGFSFMTVWDGMKGVILFVSELKKKPQ